MLYFYHIFYINRLKKPFYRLKTCVFNLNFELDILFMISIKKNHFLKLFLILLFLSPIYSCKSFNKDLDQNRPLSAEEKRRQNINEGTGASLGDIVGVGRKGTNYEFSTSNPLWRASLETLDFLPLTTVDYSGGVIITDWYSENNNNAESIKITLRFLSNDIRADSIKIIVHKKTCNANLNCTTNIVSSNIIKDELRSTILRKAALFQKADRQKK